MKREIKDNKIIFRPENTVDAFRLGKLAGQFKPLYVNYCTMDVVIFDCVTFDLEKLLNYLIWKVIKADNT